MTVAIREDLTYILLKQIGEGNGSRGESAIRNAAEEYGGTDVTEAELLGHLDYLNQREYIKAEFTEEPYRRPELLPPLVTFKDADLTAKGRKLLLKMEANPPKSLCQKGSATPIPSRDMPFLEKVMVKGCLEDIFVARNITEIVYQAMRDLMSAEASDRVRSKLHQQVVPADSKTLPTEIAKLWKDTDPVTKFLRWRRLPWQQSTPFLTNSDLFALRVVREGVLPSGVKPETAIAAVFSAMKDELPQERIMEIAGFLPDRIRKLWESA